MSERAPTITQVKAAARTLGRALSIEAQRVREEQGHSGHELAQELEHGSMTVDGYGHRIEGLRRRRARR